MEFEDSLAAVSDYPTYISRQDGRPRGPHSRIEQWSIVGCDRIAGTIHDRPGGKDGKRIITSPVLAVRRIGSTQTPVAFTESGSTYWLGAPATRLGVERAKDFLRFKSTYPEATRAG